MSHFYALLGVALFAVPFLEGCGAGSDESQETDEATIPTTTTTTGKTGEPVQNTLPPITFQTVDEFVVDRNVSNYDNYKRIFFFGKKKEMLLIDDANAPESSYEYNFLR